jgi:hypothetical protein
MADESQATTEKALVEGAFKDSRKLITILEQLPPEDFIKSIFLISKLLTSQLVLNSSGRGEDNRVVEVFKKLVEILE